MRRFREIRNPEHRIESPMRRAENRLNNIVTKLNTEGMEDVNMLPDEFGIDDDGNDLLYYNVDCFNCVVVRRVKNEDGTVTYSPYGVEKVF